MPRNRVVLITGASGGLGQALSAAFKGDKRILHYHKNDQFRSEIMQSSPKDTDFYQADLKDNSAIEKLFQYISKQYGQLDVFIHCAGITKDNLIIHMSDEDWDEVIRVNLSAAFLCMKYASSLMLGLGTKTMINIASLSGITGRKGQSNYAASKAGLIALTKTAALEFQGIQVLCVVPGLLPTGMTKHMRHHRDSSAMDEIAKFIVSLTHLRCVNGQVFMLEDRIASV